MIPLPLLERSAALMHDDAPISAMFEQLIKYEKNPLLRETEGGGPPLDPRLFNARTFERIASRAGITGDLELSIFMNRFADERRVFDAELERVELAKTAGRVVSYTAVGEFIRALGLKTDADVLAIRVNGYRLSPLLGQPAFALLRD